MGQREMGKKKMNKECILCGKIAEVLKVPGRDEYSVECTTCGNYTYDHFFKDAYVSMEIEKKAMVSAHTRDSFEIGKESPKLGDPDHLKKKIEEYKNKAIEEKLNNLIMYLKKKSNYLGDSVSWNEKEDQEFSKIRDLAKKKNLLYWESRDSGLELSEEGWEMAEGLKKESTMTMKDKRDQFLIKLNEISGGDINESIKSMRVDKGLGFNRATTFNFVRYFDRKEFIKLRTDAGDVISITAEGIDEVERILSNLKSPILEKVAASINYEKMEDKDFGSFSKLFWSFLHPGIVEASRSRFESGHLSDSVEASLKLMNKTVKEIVKRKIGQELNGAKLMTRAFSAEKPIIILDDLSTQTGKDIQIGYMQIFSGAMTGIRNPKAHEIIKIDMNRAVHFLFLASLLMFKLDERGKKE